MKILNKLKLVLFGYKTPKCVGLDLGSTSTKMVELFGNTLKISNYSFKEMPNQLITDSGGIVDVERLSEHILAQWNLFKPKQQNLAISVPHHAVMTKEFQMPIIKNKFKQYDYIKNVVIQDLGVEQIDFDYFVKHQDDNQQIVSVVIAKKEQIEEYQAMIQMTGLGIAAIDVGSYSVAYLLGILVKRYQLTKQTLFLDIGLNTIKSYVYVNGEYVLYRDLDANLGRFILDIWSSLNGDTPIDYTKMSYYIKEDYVVYDKISNYIVDKINVLIGVINNNLLLTHKNNLSDNTSIYLFGGNSLVNSLLDKLTKNTFKVDYLTVLLPENNHIPQEQLLRLIEAISLATWGLVDVT